MDEIIKNWVIPLCTLGGILVAIVLFITKKDEKQEVDITSMNKDIQYISKGLDEFKKSMTDTIENLRDNHIHTLQESVNKLGAVVTDMNTRLCTHLSIHEAVEKLKKE